MGWSHFPFFYRCCRSAIIIIYKPFCGAWYDVGVNTLQVLVEAVWCQAPKGVHPKLSHCFCQAESAIICSITITVRFSKE